MYNKSTISEPKAYYTCRKCGQHLFTQQQVLHESLSQQPSSPPSSAEVSGVKASWTQRNHHRRKEQQTQAVAGAKCSSVFITEPPEWVSCADEHEGRMSCPKCTARVGSFSWSGATCSCGRWVTPAFQFQLARVDTKVNISVADVMPPQRTVLPVVYHGEGEHQ